MAAKPTPTVLDESRPYWEAAQRSELMIPKCVTTGRFFFPPRIYSPFTIGGAVEWVRASGKATLYSYVINYRAVPGFEDDVPYAIAVVELEEGPRLMTNIVGIPIVPENLILDMELEVRFEERGEQLVPVFTPVVKEPA